MYQDRVRRIDDRGAAPVLASAGPASLPSMHISGSNIAESNIDAIVVGTGPGGASTARELARAGSRVLCWNRAAPRRWRAR